MPDLAVPTSASVAPGQRLARFLRQRSEPRSDPRGIRRRRESDIAACARLAGLSSTREGRQPSWRAWLTADDVVEAWVADHQGELLGHVALSEVGGDARSAIRWREVSGHPTSDLLAVSRLFVRPRVRGQGLGAALLEMAVAGARARGRIPVVEAVGASEAEFDVYKSHGWRPVGFCPARHRADGLAVHFFLAPRV